MTNATHPAAAPQATRTCAHCDEPLPLRRNFPVLFSESCCDDCDYAAAERLAAQEAEGEFANIAEDRAARDWSDR